MLYARCAWMCPAIDAWTDPGIHRWSLRWHHEPARSGAGDGVGLTAEGVAEMEPSSPPFIGRDDGGIALYANGLVYHQGRVICEAAEEAYTHRQTPTIGNKVREVLTSPLHENEDYGYARLWLGLWLCEVLAYILLHAMLCTTIRLGVRGMNT